jgi:hypothetical protein
VVAERARVQRQRADLVELVDDDVCMGREAGPAVRGAMRDRIAGNGHRAPGTPISPAAGDHEKIRNRGGQRVVQIG